MQGFAEDEKKEGYEWMYTQFMHAVSGVAPGVLYTDADPAVNAAVITCFGEATVHCWCIWHILINLESKFARSMGSEKYAGVQTIMCYFFRTTYNV